MRLYVYALHLIVYGNFDRNSAVNMKDLKQFTEYWLLTDCNEMADADYNGDCKVNFYEFSLLAENWLK